MSPDNFLSNHGIRYDDRILKGSAAEVVANLQALNRLRSIDPETNTLVDTVYQTPGYMPGVAGGPTSFAITRPLNSAMAAYRTALLTGDLAKVYAAVDLVNNYRMQGGYSAMAPPPDFDIIAEGKNALGEAARAIISERQAVLESTDRGDNPVQGSMAASPLPWYDTIDAFKALNAYVK